MQVLIENLNFVFTVNAQDQILRQASVVIKDDRIADMGDREAVAARHRKSHFDEVIENGSFLQSVFFKN